MNQGFSEHISLPRITVVTLSAADRLVFDDVEAGDLTTVISEGRELQLFPVENITAEVVKISGGHLQVDTQFFIDFLDAIPGNFDVTKEEGAGRYIVPTPWYRIQSIEGHLPMLESLGRK